MKSQLVLGLRPGPVQTEIQRLLQRESGLTFENIYKEAKAVEREHRTPLEEPGACHAYAAPVMTRPPPQERPLTDWKEMQDSLRAEIVKEMGSQLSSMKDDLLSEMRTRREPTLSQPRNVTPRVSSYTDPNQQRRQRRTDRGLQWDEQGRPICLQCGRAGHMRRNCPQDF